MPLVGTATLQLYIVSLFARTPGGGSAVVCRFRLFSQATWGGRRFCSGYSFGARLRAFQYALKLDGKRRPGKKSIAFSLFEVNELAVVCQVQLFGGANSPCCSCVSFGTFF